MDKKDKAEFSELVRRHAGIVRKVTASYCRNPDDRPDLAQEIFANLWPAWPRYDAARPFATWMYRIALNVALSYVRTAYRDRRIMMPLGDEHLSVAAPSADHDTAQALDRLHATMADFDPLDRAVLLLGASWWALWVPFAAVAIKLRFGVDLFAASAVGWVAATMLSGLAGWGGMWLLRCWAVRTGRPLLAARLDDMLTGDSLRAAQRHIKEVARFTAE